MKEILGKILSGEDISAEKRIEVARTLISKTAANVLEQKVALAVLSGKGKIRVVLWEDICRDSDADIETFLLILWMENVKVSSDFPCWRAWEHYRGSTSVEFWAPRKR